MSKGKFIVFEGCDGSGKSSVSRKVFERLQNDNINCIFTREPGGIDISEKIRNIILDPANTAMDSKTEALLYAASRRQHLAEKIIPALNEGINVLSDCFLFSSLAYQGYARGIGIEEVLKINEFAVEGYFPDMTVYFDIDPAVGLSRLGTRDFLDRLDKEKLDFHNKVHEGYAIVNRMYEDKVKVIDASRSFEEVEEEVYTFVKSLL